jgi:putative toxin-antitoxin system antitoxin component (TIGR02293 family)
LRTRRHRKAEREFLSIEETDRLARMARIQALAEDMFGDAARAKRWLREELGILDCKHPLEVARTEAGARLIEQLLAKLDWGAAA